MELPTGIVVSGKDNESRMYVLKLKRVYMVSNRLASIGSKNSRKG